MLEFAGRGISLSKKKRSQLKNKNEQLERGMNLRRYVNSYKPQGNVLRKLGAGNELLKKYKRQRAKEVRQ